MLEIVTPSIQISHLNHLQRIHILDLAHSKHRERQTTDLQLLQLGTVAQMEATLQLEAKDILLLCCKTVLANHHALQRTQASDDHVIRVTEAMIPNSHTLQVHHVTQVQLSLFFSKTAVTHYKRLHQRIVDAVPVLAILATPCCETLPQRTNVYSSCDTTVRTVHCKISLIQECLARENHIAEIRHI